MQQTRRSKAWTALAVAAIVFGIAAGRAYGQAVEEPVEPVPVAFCDVDPERCWNGVGAEGWHWEAKKLERRVAVLRERLKLFKGRPAARYSPMYAMRLAHVVYGVPLGELTSVAWCESKHYALAQNPSSTASGLFQFLDSTWWGSWGAQPFAQMGFSVFDPVANALAAARVVVRDGGWGQWACKP